MAYKVLGQAAPASTTNADLYTVPAGKSAVVSSIAVANVTGTDATYRIYVRVAGATAADANCLVKDVTQTKNSTLSVVIGVTLGAGDVLSVQTGTANAITFHAFGSEN